ncbi:uncharacterized protein K452DRAFT_50087 [Aplosporella prunicola CBS 121167]|uniref:Uncharacterized protein n=1 Tax=Aplosporella prunicola CBS 121167 TaxID=1176127 RepID=A0A6A6B9F2_9PEZI|nr:uncharacterized protein K452DRAFT_50087 [Aplosporella prunicola CBS 121167]KAF2140690.1 hypothetical protein K452DRAFT_50087 [Aplosporella prunicola CBS 121167]
MLCLLHRTDPLLSRCTAASHAVVEQQTAEPQGRSGGAAPRRSSRKDPSNESLCVCDRIRHALGHVGRSDVEAHVGVVGTGERARLCDLPPTPATYLRHPMSLAARKPEYTRLFAHPAFLVTTERVRPALVVHLRAGPMRCARELWLRPSAPPARMRLCCS